jgi:peptidoglycan hydrolase CwlO-like protein
VIIASILGTVLSVVGVVAAGATIGSLMLVGWKMIHDSGVADANRATDAAAIKNQVQRLADQVSSLHRVVTPNGKDTDQLGDIAARTEEKVDSLADTVRELGDVVSALGVAFKQHLEDSRKEHRVLRALANRKADK